MKKGNVKYELFTAVMMIKYFADVDSYNATESFRAGPSLVNRIGHSDSPTTRSATDKDVFTIFMPSNDVVEAGTLLESFNSRCRSLYLALRRFCIMLFFRYYVIPIHLNVKSFTVTKCTAVMKIFDVLHLSTNTMQEKARMMKL